MKFVLLVAVLGCASAANTRTMGKEERAMFRSHSEACMAQSGASAMEIAALLRGDMVDNPAIKKHVYCILHKCKIVGKDGKLQKAAVLGKIAARNSDKNITKILESCADQTGETPEDLAWNLFRCGYEKKAVLFDYMPTFDSSANADIENDS